MPAGEQVSYPAMPPVPTGVPHSSNVVTGTRVKFWKSPEWTLGIAAFELVSPLLILLSAKLFIFSDHEFGDFLLGAILLVAGLIGIWMLRGESRKVVLDSPCPVCGVQARRSFGVRVKRQSLSPTACGSCIAYLCARGLEVREEPLDATAAFYVVPAARYVTSVARDGAGKFQFAMPAMCATCGSHNAHELRDIIEVGAHTGGGGGLLGSIVSGAVRETVNAGAPTRYSDGLHHPASGPAQTPDAYDAALEGVKVPVCTKHTFPTAYTDDPIEYTHGDLWIKWYGFYRAFLALNKLDGSSSSNIPV